MKGYTKLELFFSDHWRWVRKLSRSRWIKPKEPGYIWLKVDGTSFESACYAYGLDKEKFFTDPRYETEDWRR